MVAFLIVMAGALLWLTFGYFAVRIEALDTYVDGWGEVFFTMIMGPIAWVVNMIDSDNNRLEAHFLNKFAPFIFLSNLVLPKTGKHRLLKTIFRLKEDSIGS